MALRSKLLLVLSAAAFASVTVLWARHVGDTVAASDGSTTLPGGAAEPLGTVGSGPSAKVFAARVDELLPRLEAHVVAGAGRSSGEPAEACARDAALRSSELDDIARALFEGDRPAAWTDDAARSLAAPLVDAAEPLRRCVACGPRHGCADAVRALVRVENALRAYRLQRSGS